MSQFGPEIDALFVNATEDVPFRKILEACKPRKMLKNGVEMVVSQSLGANDRTVHQQLQSALERANETKVITDSRARVRRAIDTINRNLGKLSCELGNGRTIHGKDFQQSIPAVFASPEPVKTHVATATVGNKSVKLEIEWKP
jgi:hypothetical protein